MNHIKHGFKSILRTKGKSILFFLLLTLLVTVLSLGFSVYHSITSFLNTCEERYHSIAVLEYIGQEYPDMHVDDPELKNLLQEGKVPLSEMENLPGVIYFSEDKKALALTDKTRVDSLVYQKNESVLSVYHLIYDAHARAYMGFIKECMYSLKDYTGYTVFIPEDSLSFLGEIDKNKTYVFSGTYFQGPSSYIWFKCRDGEELTDLSYETYKEKATILSYQNNAFPVSFVRNMEESFLFQQEVLSLIDGEIFTEDVEDNQIVISDLISALLHVNVGDKVNLSVNINQNGIYSFENSNLSEEKEYEVIGIYSWTKEYPDLIFMPDREKSDERIPTGYTIGTFRLQNKEGENFLREAKQMLPKGFRLTLYDEGYNLVANPYRELKNVMIVFLIVSILISVSVIFLFEFLFVYRMKESTKTMRYLGTSYGKIFIYFFTGSIFIFALSSVCGILLSRQLESYVLKFISDFSNTYEVPDLSYSSSALSIVKTLEFTPVKTVLSYVYSLLLLFVCMVISILFFMLLQNHKKTKKKKNTKVHVPKKISKKDGFYGYFRILFVSLSRNFIRILSVILLTVSAMMFLSELSLSSDLYEKKLSLIEEETVLRGYASDLTGLNMNHLVIDDMIKRKMEESSYFDSLDVSKDVSYYRYLGVSVLENGEEMNLTKPYIPEDPFGIETLKGQMALEPQWVATSSLSNSPEFYYYEDEAPIEFYKGFSEKDLLEKRADICILPESMMRKNQISLGDTIRIMTVTGTRKTEFPVLDLKVIGVYTAESTGETMYSPIALLYKKLDPETFYNESEDYSDEILEKMTYSSMIFTLKSAKSLDDVKKSFKELGFTIPLKRDFKRSYVVIEDKDYLNTVRALKRQIVYLDVLYQFLYVFMMAVSFVSAYLLMSSRSNEIELMRILGTKKTKIFLNFILEELILLVIGFFISLFSFYLLSHEIRLFTVKLLLFYLLFSCLGTGIRLVNLLYIKKIRTLSEGE